MFRDVTVLVLRQSLVLRKVDDTYKEGVVEHDVSKAAAIFIHYLHQLQHLYQLCQLVREYHSRAC